MNWDRLVVMPQYLLPKQALTLAMGRLARAQAGAATTALIRAFIARYDVDMSEAAEPDPAGYRTFNAFFTRALRPGARPVSDSAWVCPVDGAISRFGSIEQGRLLQAKGHDYPLAALLGDDADLAGVLQDGRFATLYLAPRDYHRIHMPHAGQLRRMRHVPGALFSVNPVTARGIPGLFARNERVVCHFVDDAGKDFVVVLVGATVVGSMETVWHGVVNGNRPDRVRDWQYEPGEVRLEKGAEMGRFALGSTVIVLTPPGPEPFPARWQPGVAIRLGEPMFG